MKILIPGSFDPPTNGHIDVINRCSEIFSEIIVGVVVTPQRNLYLHQKKDQKCLKKFVSKNL